MNHPRLVIVVLFHGLALVGSLAQAQEVSEQFKRLDRNKDGQVTREEFPGPVFDRIDTNKDSVITAEEDRRFQRRQRGERFGARIAESVEAVLDIPYADTDNPRQRLDLYLPKQRKPDEPLAVIVFIHGGGWQGGDKRTGYAMVAPMVESGQYIGVSVGYRLSGEAAWPAQIHDCKAAIRWITANADKYNIDAKKIGVTGTSAGGHLAAMLGTSGDVSELEGQLGTHLQESSRVHCVVDQFGPADLLTMGGWHNDADSPESKLLGGPVQENAERARAASPISYISKDDPPFLIIHGTDDATVPFHQSELLHGALRKAGVESLLIPVKGGGHGNFRTSEVEDRMRQFFDKYLLGNELVISAEPIHQGALGKGPAGR